jgi:hypothetical protein
MNVLVSLHKGYGLGDAVQMSSVLRHVAKYRPEWRVDYRAEEGKHQVGRGIVANTFAYGQPYPSTHYDAEVQICLYDTWRGWGDRPETRVSSALHEHFDLEWDAKCGQYRVDVDSESEVSASALIHGANHVQGIKSIRVPQLSRTRYVAVHYTGDSCPASKDLTHDQADDVCAAILRLGCVPIILDWRGKSPLTYRKVRTPAHWGGDAEMVSAVIRQCVAFVGVDSGPAKCASSTDVPSLVVWTGHHPAPFHDPAPNTTHLVPVGYHSLHPVRGNQKVINWFEDNYIIRQYEQYPVKQVARWLQEVLS